MAKALACRLMQDKLKDFGDDGWGAADVFVSNLKSQGVCKSIGGEPSWTSSWRVQMRIYGGRELTGVD